SAIPQSGHVPAPGVETCGCIGQVYPEPPAMRTSALARRRGCGERGGGLVGRLLERALPDLPARHPAAPSLQEAWQIEQVLAQRLLRVVEAVGAEDGLIGRPHEGNLVGHRRRGGDAERRSFALAEAPERPEDDEAGTELARQTCRERGIVVA